MLDPCSRINIRKKFPLMSMEVIMSMNYTIKVRDLTLRTCGIHSIIQDNKHESLQVTDHPSTILDSSYQQARYICLSCFATSIIVGLSSGDSETHLKAKSK